MDIKVFCPGAAKEALTRLAPAFEAQAGYSVIFTFGTVGMLKDKLDNGEAADVAILTVEILQRLPHITPDSIVEIGKSAAAEFVRFLKHDQSDPILSASGFGKF